MLRTTNHWLIAGGGLRKLTTFLVLLFGVSSGYAQGLKSLARAIRSLIRHNGNAFAVAYLKECARLVYLEVAGRGTNRSQAFPLVGVSGRLPSIIPSVLRKQIRERHLVLTVLVLSVIGVYRGLVTPPKLKLESITSGYTGEVEHFVGLSTFAPGFVKQLRLPRLSRPSLWLSTSVGPHGLQGGFTAIRDAASLLHPSGAPILGFLRAYCVEVYGRRVWLGVVIRMRFFAFVHKVLYPSWHPVSGVTTWLSRLHKIEEAAGKLRIVAIVDYWTQALLRPLHRALFDALREIPQDGTFDQEGCVTRTKRAIAKLRAAAPADQPVTVYSYDLSSATDRVPLHVYQVLLQEILSPQAATLWKHVLTAREWWDRDFDWDPEEGLQPKGAWIGRKYLVGQPMGAYSSWAMLAVAHHAIVQYCASLEGLEGWFEQYAVVGDDIVIYHDAVAKRYLAVVTGLGISVSMEKSIVSETGVFEFCKRLVTPEGDASGIPVKLIYQIFRNPLDAGSLIRHLDRRGLTLLPIAVARAVGSLTGVGGRLNKPISALPAVIRMALAMCVQPGFPWWRGIFLIPLLPTLSVEELEELLRTGRKPAADELGMYGRLETLAFRGFLDRCRPGNWTKALETVPSGVTKWLQRSMLVETGRKLRFHKDTLDLLVLRILRWGTPQGWWLMGYTMSQVMILVRAALAAFAEVISLPGQFTVLWMWVFFLKRIRDRVLEDCRGNSLEYLTAVTRAKTRSSFNLTFSADDDRAARRERRRMNWIHRALRNFGGTLPPPIDTDGLEETGPSR